MFRMAHRSSSDALNCVCNLWFIYPYGDRSLSRLSGKWINVEPSINIGIINSNTKLHLVGISTEYGVGADNVILIIQCESHATMARYLPSAVYEEWIPGKTRSRAPCLIRSHTAC
jgi:hypothetical protein